MYAIKILNRDNVTLYLADIVHYKNITYKDMDEFFEHVRVVKPDVQIGDDLVIDTEGKPKEGSYLYMDLLSNSDNSIVKRLFILPYSVIYIMQDGKTIEVVKVD